MAKHHQPEWQPPPRKNQPILKLFNSLTRRKEEFIPQNGNQVLWYSCGPTVYDASHMGHARSYISFDIIRRVLSDYFGYKIRYVMNITDIDDKIIKRARQNYLYEEYIKANHTLKQHLDDSKLILDNLTKYLKETMDQDKKVMMEKTLVKISEAVDRLHKAVLKNNKQEIENAQMLFLQESKDPLSEWLDIKYGNDIKDNSIFTTLPRYWEADFHKDMDSLNVLRPSVLTRVSEYIPEIIEYIQKIVENDFAYESNGSVYFNVQLFDSKVNHSYAKLVPEAFGDAKSLLEGEGDLSNSEQRLAEKRSANDFALWKASKAGEPWWDSPWGKGRPGWHIECSVMASAICGKSLDIHTGGVDLKFPHHDNELAQAEAYFDNNEWVRYFLHSGHLTIAGCKMSKSLKNFITIKDALEKNTSRQLRLAFLLHSWKDTLDYSPNTMEMAVQYERFLNEFFLNINDLTRKYKKETSPDSFQKWTSKEMNLRSKFEETQENVHNALCDNIDTRTSLDILRKLISTTNLYIRDTRPVNCPLLLEIAQYASCLLTTFGAIFDDKLIGIPVASSNQKGDLESSLTYLDILATFRETVRSHARTHKVTSILTECDLLRDEILPDIGVRLEDKEGGGSAIKIVDRETLLREREARKKQEEEKAIEKAKKKAEQEALNAQREAQKRIKPEEMFLQETEKYSQWDDKGLPTHDNTGKELSKGQIKKLQKLQQTQEKKYNDYINSLKENGDTN